MHVQGLKNIDLSKQMDQMVMPDHLFETLQGMNYVPFSWPVDAAAASSCSNLLLELLLPNLLMRRRLRCFFTST